MNAAKKQTLKEVPIQRVFGDNMRTHVGRVRPMKSNIINNAITIIWNQSVLNVDDEVIREDIPGNSANVTKNTENTVKAGFHIFRSTIIIPVGTGVCCNRETSSNLDGFEI